MNDYSGFRAISPCAEVRSAHGYRRLAKAGRSSARSSTFHREALISQRILPEDQGGGCIGFYVGLQTSLDRRCDRPPIRQGRGYHHNGYEFHTSGIKKTCKKTRKRYFALLILVVTNRLYREFRFLHNYIGDVWFWQ